MQSPDAARRRIKYYFRSEGFSGSGFCVASIKIGSPAAAHRYDYIFFDALMITAALEVRCATLYSEDTQHGQKIGGLVIRNPFRGPA